jgi:hypothetical protein
MFFAHPHLTNETGADLMTSCAGRAFPKSALVVAIIAWAGLSSAHSAAADIWECTDRGNKHFTNIDPSKPHYLCTSRDNPKVRIISPEGGPGCQFLQSQPAGTCKKLDVAVSQPAVPAEPTQQADPVTRFREGLRIGDRSVAGLVIDVKPPIAKIQTATGERWFRIDELQPVR